MIASGNELVLIDAAAPSARRAEKTSERKTLVPVDQWRARGNQYASVRYLAISVKLKGSAEAWV